MALEFKQIVSKEKDMAGKWRVMVDVGGESIMLKFNEDPDLSKVISETNKVISSMDKIEDEELKFIKEQIKTLEERKVMLEEKKKV